MNILSGVHINKSPSTFQIERVSCTTASQQPPDDVMTYLWRRTAASLYTRRNDANLYLALELLVQL